MLRAACNAARAKKRHLHKIALYSNAYALHKLRRAWRAWGHRRVWTRRVFVGPGPKILIEFKHMSRARPTLLNTIAAYTGAHSERLVWAKGLLLGVRQHAGQRLDKPIDLGDHVHLFIVVPQHKIGVPLLAQPGLTRGVVLRHSIRPVLAFFDGIRHVLVVQLLQRQILLHRALHAIRVVHLHACSCLCRGKRVIL